MDSSAERVEAAWAQAHVSADPEIINAAVELFRVVARYHRLTVRGLDNIPKNQPALLVGNHNGGLNPVDGVFLVDYYRARGYGDPIYILGHDMLFRPPRLRRLMEGLGCVRAEPRAARRLLDQGHKVLVFPGGDIENLRPFGARKKIILAGHKGFARLAQSTGVPIVPVVSAGSHETLFVIRQGRRLARAMGLERMRVHSLPLTLALPWGFMFGPMCALPYVPLPAKITVQIGEAIHPRARSASVERLYEAVETRMQRILHELYAERRLPIVG
jgi:1-acyl-sn-glycerol-3-phosphate acyltransferase